MAANCFLTMFLSPVPPQKPLLVSEPAGVESYQEGGVLQLVCIVKSGECCCCHLPTTQSC